MEKLIFPVSVTQKEQLSGVFISDIEKSAFMRHPNKVVTEMNVQFKFEGSEPIEVSTRL